MKPALIEPKVTNLPQYLLNTDSVILDTKSASINLWSDIPSKLVSLPVTPLAIVWSTAVFSAGNKIWSRNSSTKYWGYILIVAKFSGLTYLHVACVNGLIVMGEVASTADGTNLYQLLFKKNIGGIIGLQVFSTPILVRICVLGDINSFDPPLDTGN